MHLAILAAATREVARGVAGGFQNAIKEPEVGSPQAYRRHVSQLAAEFAGIFAFALTGIVLIIWQGHLLVTLSQRSNVETLTLAFFLVLFGYLIVLTAPGVRGAGRIVYFALLKRFGSDPTQVERRKVEAAPPPQPQNPVAGLNVIVEKEGQAGEPFRLQVADEAGTVSELVLAGAELRELQRLGGGSNSLLAFVVEQINAVLQERGARPQRQVDIVAWKLIDDEQTEQYLGMAHFAHRLERHLGAGELWPKVTLTDADCQELERRLSQICPSLRDEAFLPHWEFQAQHKVPLIPEPLGLVQLNRTERRADPVASMGCAVLVAVFAVIVLALIIVFPPWVPGA